MSSQRSSVIAIPAFVAKQTTASHSDPDPAAAGRTSDDHDINKLSKRLWMLEIHQRLETQARRTLAPDGDLQM